MQKIIVLDYGLVQLVDEIGKNELLLNKITPTIIIQLMCEHILVEQKHTARK